MIKKISLAVVALAVVVSGSYLLFGHTKEADATANTYYVDQSIGSDSNGGLSEADSFLTIQKAADTVVAGDTVYIKNGTYREGVDFTTSGTASERVVFSAYSGHSPVISGSDLVTSWSVYSGNVYQATWNSSGTSLWEDTTNKLTRQANLVSVDAVGEWYLDDAGNTLYVYTSDSTSPATHTIEISIVGRGYGNNTISTSTEVDYLTIIGLKAIHAENDGFNFHGASTNLIFEDIVAEENGFDGFSIHDTSTATVTNLTVNKNGKCNIANVGDSEIVIDGLTMSQGPYGPDRAANLLFTGNSSVTITNANLSQGSYKNNYVFYALTTGTVLVTDSTITGGSSSGVVRVTESTTFDRVTFDGGSLGKVVTVTADAGDRAYVKNSVFKNVGDSAVFTVTDNAKVRVQNSLVVGQTGGQAMYAYATGSIVEVYNTIFANNTTKSFYQLNGTVTEDYNIMYNSGGYGGGASAGANTTSEDPLFTDYAGGDYSLLSTSPAIDSANSTYSSTTDLNGKQRYDFETIANTGVGTYAYYDMGPNEYVTPVDATFISTSHPTSSVYYNDSSVDMTLTSDDNSTTNYRYVATQNTSESDSTIIAGSSDADGDFTVNLNADGVWYIHTLAVSLDDDPAANGSATLVKNDAYSPTISSVSVANSGTLSGIESISAIFVDSGSGMNKVEYYVDSVLAATYTSSPYSFSWNTLSYDNGTYVLLIKAFDMSNNYSSTTINVTISNDSEVGGATISTTNSSTISPTTGQGSETLTDTTTTSSDTSSEIIDETETANEKKDNTTAIVVISGLSLLGVAAIIIRKIL